MHNVQQMFHTLSKRFYFNGLEVVMTSTLEGARSFACTHREGHGITAVTFCNQQQRVFQSENFPRRGGAI